MEPSHNYITTIKVNGLWGALDLRWDLNPDINILSGMNGSGKSTILHALAHLFRSSGVSAEGAERFRSICVCFEDGRVISSENPADKLPEEIDIISTFDNRINDFGALQKLSDGCVRTELDWEIYRMQKRYMSYQLAEGKRAIALLSSGAKPEELAEINRPRQKFFDIMDSLFSHTHKTIDRTSDELSFFSRRGVITPYMLSSGEKQILLIMSTVLTQQQRPSILIMDEPEISLHFDWQVSLIENIRSLNPHVQLIVSTHSPALVMNGWMDCVKEVSELIVK